MKKLSKGLVPVVVLILASLVLAACGGSGGGGSAATLNVTAKEAGCASGTYCFDPGTLSANSGQEVTIKFSNPNAQVHTFVFKEAVPGATRIEAQANGNGEMKFTAPAAGTYTFYCDVPGHEQLGMHGTLTVK